TTASRSGSRWLPRSMMASSSVYGMVDGIRATAAADRVTPQSASVSKLRLSVATTEVGGVCTVVVPWLSSTSTLPDPDPPLPPASEPPAASAASVEPPPQAVSSMPTAPAAETAPRWRREIVLMEASLDRGAGTGARWDGTEASLLGDV